MIRCNKTYRKPIGRQKCRSRIGEVGAEFTTAQTEAETEDKKLGQGQKLEDRSKD